MTEESGKLKTSRYLSVVLLPVFDSIIFPFELVAYTATDLAESNLLVQAIEHGSCLIGVYYAANDIAGDISDLTEETIGTLCKIDQEGIDGGADANGKMTIIFPLAGTIRFRLIRVSRYIKVSHIKYPIQAEIEIITDNVSQSSLEQSLLKKCMDLIGKIRSSGFLKEGYLLTKPEKVKYLSVGQLADAIVACFYFENAEEKIQLFKILDPVLRFKKVVEILERAAGGIRNVPVRYSSGEGKGETKTGSFEKRKGKQDESFRMRERYERIKNKISEADRRYVLRELEKLANLHPESQEYSVSYNWLNNALSFAELESDEECKNLKEISRILDEDHFGLREIKERIIDDVAVRILNPGLKGSILCFVGPPGVGKTSLGKSIARALNRKFIRWSAGGVRDEAEIRGHRRTYVGAKPGRIIEALINGGSSNPVFMIDEIDKLGQDFRGDPSSALLEVLDPEQNSRFSDHYLEITTNLSKILFIVTANTAEPIPPALKDRLEILRLPGYAEEEKMGIAKEFLIPKQLKEKGLFERLPIEFEDEALGRVIREYTKEAGVRNLERAIATIFRKLARKVAETALDGRVFEITVSSLPQFLGAPKHVWDKVSKNLVPGICNGLAVTEYGGKVLQIQFRKQKGSGQIILTGSLGEVMKESAIVARSLLRSRIHTEKNKKLKDDFHFHAPDGATPKEGSSAGVTFFLAGYSGLKDIPVKDLLAVTGEIDLKENILPVGGIQEKITGGAAEGIKEFLLPEGNRPDVDNLAEDLGIKKMILEKKITIHFIKTIDEALDITFPERKDKKLK